MTQSGMFDVIPFVEAEIYIHFISNNEREHISNWFKQFDYKIDSINNANDGWFQIILLRIVSVRFCCENYIIEFQLMEKSLDN